MFTDIFEEASFLDDKRFQIEVNKILFYGRTQLDRGVATWVRGTVQMILMAAEYYSNRIKNPETADEFEEILREELFNSLDTMHDRAKELINRLD